MSNPCIQCGKERIDGKTWEEKSGISVITHMITVCPDPECQKLVDKTINDRKEKNLKLGRDRAKAKLAREKQMAAS